MCFSKKDVTTHDSLSRPMNMENIDNSLWNDKCDYWETEQCANLNPNNYNFIIMQLNIRTLLSNATELKILLTKLEQRNSPVDAILLCETFLTKKTEKLVNIPYYHLYTTCRNNHKGGGTAILVRNGINHKQRKDLNIMMEKEVEATYVEMTAKCGKRIILGSLYKSPNTSDDKLKLHLVETCNKIKQERHKKELVIGMDHNMDLLKSYEHRRTQQFLDILINNDLIPTITRPTRITKTSATLIDNVFISKMLQESFDSMILIEEISDHLPSLVLMKQTKLRNKDPLQFKSRKLTEDKIQNIKDELKQKDWNGILRSDNVNINFDNFCTELDTTMEKFAPIKEVRISWKRKYIEPWMSKPVERAAQRCKYLYKKSILNDATNEDRIIYKNYRNLYNRIKRKARSDYYATKCEEYGRNIKQLWKVINETICKKKHSGSIIPYITINGIKTYDPKKIANSFGSFYATIGSELVGKLPKSRKNIDDYVCDIPRTLNSLKVKYIKQTDIEKIINSLPAKTSSGHDGISNKLLKDLNHTISYPLSVIFNQSLESGIFPDKMKIAEIIPLHKNKEEDLVNNYRPISLLMTISKILEKIIYTNLYGFLTKHNLFFDSQYGFRTKRSCEHAIMEMVGHVLHAKNEGKHTMGVFLDLSKAFDTLDHNILISKLERYGVRGVMLDWFKSYLTGRSLVAKISTINGDITKSNYYDISFGTAQGSCLGPLLFVIFCNDIYQLPIFGKLILFADDTTLIESHKNKKFLQYAVNHDMILLMDWFIANKLTLNLSKTLAMEFWSVNNNNTSKIQIGDAEIPLVHVTKFLGVYLDDKLKWEYHANQVYNKIQSNKQLLNVSKNFLNIPTLLKIYYSHIHSHLRYGLVVWGSMMTKTSLTELEKLQKTCIRLVNKKKKNAPTNELFIRNRLLKFSDMIHIELLKFGYRLSKRNLPDPINNVMTKNRGQKTHPYQTRNKMIPNIQRHTDQSFNSSYLCKGVSMFINSGKSIKDAKTLKRMISEAKNSYISKY